MAKLVFLQEVSNPLRHRRGFSGKVFLFALAQLQVGSLPAFRFEWHVLHINSVLLKLLIPVRHKLRISLVQDLYKSGLHVVTDLFIPYLFTTRANIFGANTNVFMKHFSALLLLICGSGLGLHSMRLLRAWPKSVSLSANFLFKLLRFL